MSTEDDFLDTETRAELEAEFEAVDLGYKYAVGKGKWDAPFLAQAIRREQARRAGRPPPEETRIIPVIPD